MKALKRRLQRAEKAWQPVCAGSIEIERIILDADGIGLNIIRRNHPKSTNEYSQRRSATAPRSTQKLATHAAELNKRTNPVNR